MIKPSAFLVATSMVLAIAASPAFAQGGQYMTGDDHGQGMMNDGDHGQGMMGDDHGQGMMGDGHGMDDQDSQ